MTSWLRQLLWRLLLVAVLATGIYWAWIYASPWTNQPIRQVVLQGDIPRSEQQIILAQLQNQDLGRFFSVNLNQVKDQVESNVWVDGATVSRVWPDRLMVELSPQVIVARWGDGQVLNHHWQVLDLDLSLVTNLEALPVLQGPLDQTQKMAASFRSMSAVLAREELAINTLRMAKRGAVDLALDNDIEVLLGRDEGMQRLRRVVQIYDTDLASLKQPIARIDGRYPHGVAVAMKSQGAVAESPVN
jgi:cell division protein FtsQ